jgi:hypothetical protein
MTQHNLRKRQLMKIPSGMATIVVIGLLASALSGCGGGSSTLATTPTATSFDLQTGVTGLVMNGQTATVALSGTAIISGSSVPFTGTGTLTLAPAVTATFNGAGALAQTETISGTVTAAGQSEPYSSSVTDFYATGNDAFVGETGTNEYDVAQAPFTYPTAVMAGSSGVLGTTSNYTDSTMAVAQGTTQVSYAVTAVSGSSTSVMVAITDQVNDTQGTSVETDVTNYSLTDAGVLSLVSASVQDSSGTLTVTVQ